MRGNEFLDKMNLVDSAYIEAANIIPKRRKINLKKWCLIAACFCIVFSITVSAMESSFPLFYSMMYNISPATAQFFKPVQMSCEDNGIRMEVKAAYIHGDTAEIYISMQDLAGTRIDETIDLFDSYEINTPFDCMGHCSLISFDSNTQTATFLITVKQLDGQNIIGDKLTFSVREFIADKKTYDGPIDGVSLESADLNPEIQTVYLRGGGGEMYRFVEEEDKNIVLKPSRMVSPVDGVTLTGIGYIDGKLHIQTYYDDISNTGNHGYIYLINRETKEVITSDYFVSFFDDEGKGSYDDDIFIGIDPDTLSEYELYGYFVTSSSGAVKGNWSITFPLENIDNK